MIAMSEPIREKKLGARAVIEVFQALNQMEGLLLRKPDIQFFYEGKMKTPTQAALIQAILLHVGTLSEKEQVRIIAAGMSMLNEVSRANEIAKASESLPDTSVTDLPPSGLETRGKPDTRQPRKRRG